MCHLAFFSVHYVVSERDSILSAYTMWYLKRYYLVRDARLKIKFCSRLLGKKMRNSVVLKCPGSMEDYMSKLQP